MTSDSPTVSINRQDVAQTLAAYTETLKCAGRYYRKVLELSQTATEFANTLESLGKCKGAEQSGTGMKSAAELHRIIAKNQEQLAEAIHKEFELPLQRNLSAHQKRVEDNERMHEKGIRKIQDEISKTETKMLKGRKKDMSAFQQSLQDMQKLAQELEQTRTEQVEQVLAEEQKNFMFLVQKTAGVVKSQYEHFTTLASLSRDVTEDIISIAFAPPGKTLDAAEKKRVVDKFLGSSSVVATDISGNSPASSKRNSIHSFEQAVDARRPSVLASVPVVAAGAPSQRPPVPPTGHSSASPAVTTRPATPPVSPMPTATSFMGRRTSNSTIQDSLQRLSMAASQVGSETAAVVADDKKPAAASTNTSDENNGNASNNLDLVIAVHDFAARTERELSFKKNDVLLIKQRQENWLYATHYADQAASSKSGWIPVSYTTKFELTN